MIARTIQCRRWVADIFYFTPLFISPDIALELPSIDFNMWERPWEKKTIRYQIEGDLDPEKTGGRIPLLAKILTGDQGGAEGQVLTEETGRGKRGISIDEIVLEEIFQKKKIRHRKRLFGRRQHYRHFEWVEYILKFQ